MELTQEIIKELLDYNPETGILMWKARSRERFTSDGWQRRWNNRYAGTEAGMVCKTGSSYKVLTLLGKSCSAHRLVWLYVHGTFPKNQVDHINGNGADNRLSNLRDVTTRENSLNRRISPANKSGVAGVIWCKKHNKWLARIVVRGKLVYLGMFTCLKKAATTRKAAEQKYGFHKNHGRAH